MHLDNHPLAGALFERAGPATIIPTDGLAVPLGVIVEHARVPGNVSRLGEFEAQILIREIGGIERVFHPEALAQLLEHLKVDYR